MPRRMSKAILDYRIVVVRNTVFSINGGISVSERWRCNTSPQPRQNNMQQTVRIKQAIGQ